MEKEYIKFYQGWFDSIEAIPDEAQQAELALAIIRYAIRGEKYAGTSPFVCVMMPTIYKSIDAANFFAEAGRRGGNKAANKGATEGGMQGATEGGTETNKQINNKQVNNKQNTDKDKKTNIKFVKPTLDEVKVYCQERGNNVNAERFIAYYESNGWKVGRNPMKDWRAAVRTWEQKDGKNNTHTEDLTRPAVDEDGMLDLAAEVQRIKAIRANKQNNNLQQQQL